MTYIWRLQGWPKLHWQESTLLSPLTHLAEARGRLFAVTHGLSLSERTAMSAEVTAHDAEGTAKIEGVDLPPASVRSSVAHRLGLDTAGLPAPHRDVDGLVEVLLDATQNARDPLTPGRLFGWHAALFPTGYSGMRAIDVGRWRAGPMSVRSGPIGSERVHFEAPPSERVEPEIEALLQWWHTESRGLDGVIRAGVAHLWFETIHPFDDGNGRLGRALADMALAQADRAPARYYSLSRAILDDRAGYYRQLQAAQTGSLDVTEWILWFVDAVTRAVGTSLQQIKTATRRGRLRSRIAASGLDARQLKVLNKLIDAEPEGFEGGLSNVKYSRIARVSRATATRDLAALVERGLLRKSEAGGRSTRYALRVESLDE